MTCKYFAKGKTYILRIIKQLPNKISKVKISTSHSRLYRFIYSLAINTGIMTFS